MVDAPRDGARRTHHRNLPVDQDLRELHARSARRLPSLAAVGARARSRRTGSEGGLVSVFRVFVERPRLTAGLTAAVVGLALLIVPISYDKVVGQEVSLTLSGPGLDKATLETVADRLSDALEDVPVTLAVEQSPAGKSYTLSAVAPGNRPARARAAADALVSGLEERGWTASAEVHPKRERVSGNLYAMARDNVIQVSIDGKSDDELEAEIRDALLAAGIPDAQVSVTTSADGEHQTLEVGIQRTVDSADGSVPEVEPVDIVLTRDGQPLGGFTEATREDMKVMIDGEGTMTVEFLRNGQPVTAAVEDVAGKSDQEIATLLTRQLADQGVTDLSVSVEDGRVHLLRPTDLPVGSTEETTWGELKKDFSKP